MTDRIIASDKGLKPPEVRVLRISNDSELFLTFTHEMVFPNDFTDTLNKRSVKRKSTEPETDPTWSTQE